MESSKNAFHIREDRVSSLRKIDLFGSYNPGLTTFDHRDQTEPVGIYLSQLRIDSISLWFLRTDNQNVALQGMATTYRRLNENNYFDPYQDYPEKLRNSDKDYEILHLEDGEYIKGIDVTVANANNKIGALEFITTKKGRKQLMCGARNEEPKPPGTVKKFDFTKAEPGNITGYVVGFYGQFYDDFITHLGVYIAPINEINYYTRRGFILLYKKMQQDKKLVEEIAKRLGVERDDGMRDDRWKDAKLEGAEGHTSKTLFYFLNSALLHPELFKNVLEYL